MIAGERSGTDSGRDVPVDLALASPWAPGAAVSALPLALGASAHLEASGSSSPFRAFTDEGEYTYWRGLDAFTQEHESARIGGYGGAGGTAWAVVWGLTAAALVALWILGTIRAVRVLGAPTALDGLRVGALVGTFGVVLLGVLAWLTPLAIGLSGVEDLPAAFDPRLRWGHVAGGTAQAAAELLVLTALAGAAYAAFRPARHPL